MISWPNKGKQTPNPVPTVTTARGERDTVLVLSFDQKDSGPLTQKAVLFFGSFLHLKKQEQTNNKKNRSTRDTTSAQISREIAGKFIRLVSRWLCRLLYLESKLPGKDIILNRTLHTARSRQTVS